MEKYRYKIDKRDEEYFTFSGRWFDYIYGENKPEYALRIGETADYFYFTITALYDELGDEFDVNIGKDNIMYNEFNKLLKGFYLLDVCEEGTPERKSLEFKKQKDNIQIKFKNIPEHRTSFCTIEFANVRRWGDTRFVDVKSISDANFYGNLQKMGKFRYEFKERLHNMFNVLEELFDNQNIINIER